MPVAVNLSLSGSNDMISAIKKLQSFLGRPVSVDIGEQNIQSEIIKLENYLQTQGKWSAGNINTTVADVRLPAKIMELQVAANLP